MTDPRRPTPRLGSSALLPAGHDVDSSAIRPRNRRLISTESGEEGGLSAAKSSPSLFSSFSSASSRLPSPRPADSANRDHESRSASNPPLFRGANVAQPSNKLGLLETSLTQSWTSLQGFASSLISGDGDEASAKGWNSRAKGPSNQSHGSQSRRKPELWGPSPPNTRLVVNDIGAGALADRQAALRAARTASVLESHEGVNGGLDITGRYKRRTSEDFGSGTLPEDTNPDQLVYIHHVQPFDTYAGIVLRYRCREDPFRRLNGLWSKDIQARRWLALPVDCCEVKGRASGPPSQVVGGHVDYLAPTPSTTSSKDLGDVTAEADFFSLPKTQPARTGPQGDDSLWEHVRWCSLDSFSQPVEIARVSRKSLGFFPPRRKKSLQTASTASTPRASLDTTAVAADSFSSPVQDPSGLSSRRQSFISNRARPSGTPGGSTTVSERSRVNSNGAEDRPAWMRRPGGVGSMGRNVRAPGPEKDYFNTWANRHLPGIAIDEHMPSISVMGSASAHFGFTKHTQESDAAAIVESPFDDGQDLTSDSRHGSGLDRAAAQVETWLRGAFAKRPSTPRKPSGLMGRSLAQAHAPSDLIELEDTNSDDDRLPGLSCSGADVRTEAETLPSTSGRVHQDTSHMRRSGGTVDKGQKTD